MASDNGYAQHMGVCLVSLFENNKGSQFHVFVFDGGISNEHVEKLRLVAEKYKQEIEFITVDLSDFATFPIRSYYSYVTFFRLKMMDYLPSTVEKILYLDCDMIVCGDITELFATELASIPVAAVTDTPWQLGYARSNLGFSKSDLYFNSGMMLINTHLYREADPYRIAIEMSPERIKSLLYLDQDILNIVFKNNWYELPCKWNLMDGMLKTLYLNDQRHEDFSRGITERRIIHFSAKEKPWSWRCDNPLKQEYFKYLALSPWKGFKVKRSKGQHYSRTKQHVLRIFGLRRRIYFRINR